MNWKQERDLLIAQTMAFAQSVTAKAVAAESRFDARLEQVPVNIPGAAARRVEALPLARPLAPHDDLREEIRRRVAAFRDHQELLRRDRDEYCNSVLARVRTPAERGR
jgi:hypothetical protein